MEGRTSLFLHANGGKAKLTTCLPTSATRARLLSCWTSFFAQVTAHQLLLKTSTDLALHASARPGGLHRSALYRTRGVGKSQDYCCAPFRSNNRRPQDFRWHPVECEVWEATTITEIRSFARYCRHLQRNLFNAVFLPHSTQPSTLRRRKKQQAAGTTHVAHTRLFFLTHTKTKLSMHQAAKTNGFVSLVFCCCCSFWECSENVMGTFHE